jgi:L-ascorbate metabolism protein UlaG (beta-lactamase superfamily)
MKARFTYLVGPTYLIEIGSFRFLSDPGFDPEGTERSEGPGHDLRKNMAPPVPVEEIGRIDAVFVSHAHHFDNLDNTGREWLPRGGRILSDQYAADALRGSVDAEVLATWQSTELTNEQGERITVTAMPAVHTNNEDIRSAVGETTGFLLEWDGQKDGGILITGDSVWIEDYEEIEKRYKVGTGILHMGAANVPAVGDIRLTMNGEEGARLTELLNLKNVFPAHFEGWLHYKEGREKMGESFDKAGMAERLHPLLPGKSFELEI